MKEKMIIYKYYLKTMNAIDRFNKARFMNKDTRRIIGELVEGILGIYQAAYTPLEKGILLELKKYLSKKIENSASLNLQKSADDFMICGLTDENGNLIFKYENLIEQGCFELNEYYQFRNKGGKRASQKTTVGFVIPHAVAYGNKLYISPSSKFGVYENDHQRLLYGNSVFVCKTYEGEYTKSFVKVFPAIDTPVTSLKFKSGVEERNPRAQFSVFKNIEFGRLGKSMKCFSTNDEISEIEYKENLDKLNEEFSLIALSFPSKSDLKKKVNVA